MTTISDTLKDIIKIQKEFEIIKDDLGFKKELTNFTSAIYFEYLSHAILDKSRHINLSGINGATKYYELLDNKVLLKEYIRFNNIGQFSIIWNAYEKYLRKFYLDNFDLTQFKISLLFQDLLNKKNPSNKDKILSEFEVMRNTRNSLHDGGIYNSSFSVFSGKINGNIYSFSPGEPVIPLRIMDVIATLWSHYKILEEIEI